MAVLLVLSIAGIFHDAPQLHHSDDKIAVRGMASVQLFYYICRKFHTMKRLLTLFVAIFTILTATAQEEYPIILDQASLRKMVSQGTDNANIDPIRKDSSRNACARIKIRFANLSRAEVDELKIERKSNNDLVRQEILYFDNVLILEMTARPYTRFYVQSPEYGQSNEVTLNLEGNCEYEMEARLNSRFSIIVESNVAGAEVYIDGVKKATIGDNCKVTIDDVMVGTRNLKVSYNGVSASKTIEVRKGSISFTQEIDKSALEPQFVVFNVEPKSAVVIINNDHYPLQDGSMSIVLASGKYDYTVTAVGYHPQSGTFTVAGSTVDKRVTLIEDSAKVTISVADNAEIWINGKMKGTGSWSGTLNSGAYIFEARKAGCKSSKISKQISSSAAAQSITLPAPTPIVGTLIVASTPVGASVSVDNKTVGTTPLKLGNIFTGTRTLKISKAGYADFTQSITITEGKATTINATLTKLSADPVKSEPSAIGSSVEPSIILEQSTLREVFNTINFEPIKKDPSYNKCARLMIRFANMSRDEVKALDIRFMSNTILTKRYMADSGSVLILEMTAKSNTRFYVQSPKYGRSNEVVLNLDGDCEYDMEARLSQPFSIVVNSNVAGAEVYIDGSFKGRTDKNCIAVVGDVISGHHTLKLAYGGKVYEQKIDVNKNSISFRQNVSVVSSLPQYVVFQVEPQNAVVMIDGAIYTLQDGVVSTVLLDGVHNYTVTAPGYKSESGTFMVTGAKVVKSINLTPLAG